MEPAVKISPSIRRNTDFAVARRSSGFTLLEILAAAAVLILLTAILLPVLRGARESSNRGRCDVNLKSIALALDAYRQEQGYFPSDLTELQTSRYVQDQQLFHCPSSPDPNITYADYYVIRSPRDDESLPILICPFHEDQDRGGQAYIGRYTTQFMTKPAVLTRAQSTTLKRPGKNPVAAPAGMELHGADTLLTAKNGQATIAFADGSTASLAKNSEVTILQSFLDRKWQPVLYTLLRQTAGDVDYVVNTGSKFDITTPSATAGALGTKFKLTVDSEETTLLVAHGKVRFETSKRHIPAPVGLPVKAKKNKP